VLEPNSVHSIFSFPSVFSLFSEPESGFVAGVMLDRVSVFFAAVVVFMAILIAIYAKSYLHENRSDSIRFYALMLLFTLSMLGVVLSSNLLSLFVFWEMTSLTSFFLIGYYFQKEEGWKGARMGLITTASLGLCFLAGVALVRVAYGTLELQPILSGEARILNPQAHFWGGFLLLLGAFGKSAQFPFSYWLPRAMAAPTPVSAFLHSATLVKLGVFLVARLYPSLFAGNVFLLLVLMYVGYATALYGALASFFSHDLKAILAWSTVSQLGLLMAYFGSADIRVAGLEFVHILAHVLFKGGLFLFAGLIDHSTGTRDLRLLRGIGIKDKRLQCVAALLLLSFVSFPGSVAFLSKELSLETLWKKTTFLEFQQAILYAPFLLVFVVVSLLKMAIGCRIFFDLFLAKSSKSSISYEKASWGLLFSPLVLGALSFVFGSYVPLWQFLWDVPFFLVQGVPADDPSLSLWHGFTPAFFTTVFVFLSGAALWKLVDTRSGFSALKWRRWADLAEVFESLHEWLLKFSQVLTKSLGAASIRAHLAIVLFFLGLAGIATLGAHASLFVMPEELFDPTESAKAKGARLLVCVVMALAAVAAVRAKQVLTRLVATSLVGLLVTALYVFFQAPDLALTQVLVESLLLLVSVVLLMRMKVVEFAQNIRYKPSRRLFSALIAVCFGVFASGLLFLALHRGNPNAFGPEILSLTLPEAAGKNAVNTILIDFRGTDTLFEIVVLVIAVLGCAGLVRNYVSPKTDKATAKENGHA
jgi:NADH:ubiquinone oxidoreductase subunit 5 (subunit L)/multisubunit Na+/H+ antiporter MnhA subunit/multisubunit Na+/H+ antiporter MnhB subunit